MKEVNSHNDAGREPLAGTGPQSGDASSRAADADARARSDADARARAGFGRQETTGAFGSAISGGFNSAPAGSRITVNADGKTGTAETQVTLDGELAKLPAGATVYRTQDGKVRVEVPATASRNKYTATEDSLEAALGAYKSWHTTV